MNESSVPPRADATLDGSGNACTDLTPRIKQAIASLETGRILEVVSDDPTAREGVPAWSRLTGHQLIEVIEIDPQRTRFFLRHK